MIDLVVTQVSANTTTDITYILGIVYKSVKIYWKVVRNSRYSGAIFVCLFVYVFFKSIKAKGD